jgi:hypothetical protein
MTGELAAGIGIAALAIASAASFGAWRRLARHERELAALRSTVASLEDELRATRAVASAAGTTARRAAVAAGVGDPAPRLALEPVTGPVVKAVALGAGARRALARLRPQARPRRSAMKGVAR